MQNTTELFLDGIIRIRMDTIPKYVIQKARECLLDYFGVLIGGKQYLTRKHPDLLDTFPNCSIQYATLLNGYTAHVLELDDGHRHGMIHLGAAIAPAVLAVAEEQELTSDSILMGIIAGYEVAVRCARAIQPGHKIRGYHVSGSCGTLGASMGVGIACGYNLEQLKSTLSCAVTSAAGLLEIQEDASELKPYNVGRADMDGLVAAKMGRLALPGPDDILGGKRGFLAALTDTPHPEYLIDFSNDDYAIEGIYQKVYAACRHCHPAIDAILDLRENLKFSPENVEKIEVYTYKLAVGGHDHIDIHGISSAKLSIPFGVALATVKGSAGYADYNEDNLNDYLVKDLTRKVRVIEDEELSQRSPSVRGARVTLYLKDGCVYKTSCLYPKGEPENPLSQEELEDKFRGLAMYGGLTSEECDEVMAEIWKEDFSLSKILDIVCKK